MAYFLKVSHRPKGDYLQIYNSFRDPETKKPKNKCIKTFGYECDLIESGIPDPKSMIKEEIERLNTVIKTEKENSKSKKISEVPASRNIGYLPLQKITDKLEVREPLQYMQTGRKFQFNFFDCMMFLTYARAVYPCSKKKTVDQVIPSLYGAPHFSYDQLLQCLDFIGSRYDKIIEVFTRAVHETYILDTSSVFFDCTNFYFEIDQEDELRRKGPSKERRVDPLLGMGLLLDKNCIPIGMHLYPGNESEHKEIRAVISKLKTQQNIKGKTVRVADKGLNSAENIIHALGSGDGYLFSRSIKKISAEDLKWVLDPDCYTDVFEKNEETQQERKKGKDDKVLKYRVKSRIVRKEYKFEKEKGVWVRLEGVDELQIVTYNPKLARKQIIEIDKLARKAESLCTSAAKKSEFGECSKFVDFESLDKETGEIGAQKVIASINPKKIEELKRMCGYNMLVTSEIRMDPVECYKLYHELSRIEETFKTMKSELDARPVYLQTPNRIYGHFCVCYLAVLLIRLFQFKSLESMFPTCQVCDFIRNFKILPVSDDIAYNLSSSSKLMEYLVDVFKIPVTNYVLDSENLKKILSRSF